MSDKTFTDTELRDIRTNLYEEQLDWERKADEAASFAEKVYCLKKAGEVAKERLRIEIECLGKA